MPSASLMINCLEALLVLSQRRSSMRCSESDMKAHASSSAGCEQCSLWLATAASRRAFVLTAPGHCDRRNYRRGGGRVRRAEDECDRIWRWKPPAGETVIQQRSPALKDPHSLRGLMQSNRVQNVAAIA